MTLIDTLVGAALMLIVFVGIGAAFNLSINVVLSNKARAGAISLASERMEYIRSLPYASIGTSGGIPSGSLAQTESLSFNGVSYIRRTLVQYGDDSKDGTGASDTTGIADYKAVKVEVSWTSRTGARSVYVVSRFEPQSGLESSVTGGLLSINVANAAGQDVSSAQVTIVNSSVSPAVDLTTYTNATGNVSLIGTPAGSGYSVTVTKSGYSTAQTYSSTVQNPNPSPANLTVSNNQTTSATFAIDLVSSMEITTYTLITDSWTDSFSDSTKIGSDSTNIEVSGNRARFAGNQPWTAPADLRSVPIAPAALSRWSSFSWDDTQPAETTITYHVYYPSGSANVLVPDSVLPGNSAGFTVSPVDLGAIPAGEYPSLVLGAHLVAINPSAPSPSIEDWSLSYQGGEGVSLPFTLRGAKTIGTNPTVYKYEQTLTTGSSGSLSVPNLEWDSYTTSVAAATGYDLVSTCPAQPVALAPNSSVSLQLYVSTHTSNSLFVSVQDGSASALSGASVRLTKGGSYDTTIIADRCGNAFFPNLTNGTYTLAITKSGYTSYSGNINVTGTTKTTITMN